MAMMSGSVVIRRNVFNQSSDAMDGLTVMMVPTSETVLTLVVINFNSAELHFLN